jgi:cholest-4-en-3-one 26-monooxygenase
MSNLTSLVRLEDPNFYLDDPYPVLQRIRREDPVFYYKPLDMWVMSKYEDIRYVGRTPEIFSNHDGIFLNDFRYGDVTKTFFPANSENLGLLGPPRHKEIRKIVGAAFTPQILAEMREVIRKMCCDMLAPIEAGKTINWSRQVAEPLPLLVIATLMGIPLDQYDTLKFFSDEVIKIGADTTQEEIAEIVARLAPMEEFFEKYLGEREHNPRRDLLTVLQKARTDGMISSETVHMLLSAVLTAGNETTRNTINGAIILLSDHLDQMKLLATQPGMIKPATEEFLRYLSPVRGFGRTVLQDVEVRGRKISTGQRVFNFFMSGNRDEEIFVDPEIFDLTRARDKANLGFGFGEHFCIGAALARMEICVLFEALVPRFSEVRLVGSPVRDKQLLVNSWEDVRVAFS